MPTVTPADALIRAADYLTDAISGLLPTHTVTADAVDQLMEIYKQQARNSIDGATAQTVLREHAQAERVRNKQARPVTAFPLFELEESSPTDPSPSTTPQNTQDDDYDSTPAANTRQQQETWTLILDFSSNVWKSQATRLPSHCNKQPQGSIQCHSCVIWPTQSWMMRQVTSSSTATS